MAKYLNFFETLQEAQTRLLNTVVLYDGVPYTIMQIQNHKADGIFRVYMAELGKGHVQGFAWPEDYYRNQGAGFGDWLDKFLLTDMGKKIGWVRKQINSPKFNNFRPFPLGMANVSKNGTVHYLERAPIRRSIQGLSANCVTDNLVALGQSGGKTGPLSIVLDGPEMRAVIEGSYPSAQECVENLSNPDIANSGAAFHRNFAILRGPLGLLFLAYKTEVVGLLTYGDLSEVRIAKEHRQYREVISDLKVFRNIVVSEK